MVIGGAGDAVVSGGISVVVVSVGAVVGVVVGDGFVVDDGAVIDDDGVLAGGPPLLPVARMTRPQMIVAIRITTAKPHSARTHGLRYQGDGSSAEVNSSSLFSPSPKSLSE